MARRKKPSAELTRRLFLRYSAGAGLLAGAGFPRWALAKRSKGGREERTYVFNFSHMDTTVHDLVLVAGGRRIKVKKMTPAERKKAREKHPILEYVPHAHMTHHVVVDLPDDALQLCFVKRIHRHPHERMGGSWDMVHMFYHHPSSSLHEAKRRRGLLGGTRPHHVPHKWQRYGITPEIRATLNDPVGEEALQDTQSQAVALVAGHPELAAGEADTAAHIQTNIIGTLPATQLLGFALEAQGPATPTGGWAQQKPIINDATGQPFLNADGEIQYVPIWSEETSTYAGQAMIPSLDVAIDDTSLGTNITDVDPTTITGADPDAPTHGAIWTLHDGQASVEQPGTAVLRRAFTEEPTWYELENQSPDNGYALEVKEVVPNSAGGQMLTFEAKNWYVRYLSVYVRYLDANAQPIPISSIESEIAPFWPGGWRDASSTYDVFLDLLFPEWVILGIPVETKEIEGTIPVPASATSVVLLAGGLGSGSNDYPHTIAPGVAMTVVFDLAIPSLLLACAAASGISYLQGALAEGREALDCMAEALEVLSWASLNYDEPKAFAEIGLDIGKMLLEHAAEHIDKALYAAVKVGEAEASIPIIGLLVSAIAASGLVAQIAETSSQAAKSPLTYVSNITFTHDIQVTIAHDPDNPAGFPSTATHYAVTATFDSGTAKTIELEMPGTTVTQPIVVTFEKVPAGGNVKVDVGFYSNTDFVVGRGTVGPVPNPLTEDAMELDIEICQVQIPLLATTHYAHKQIIALDAGGNHVWKAQTTPPTTVRPEGACDSTDGSICSWTGLTISNPNAAIGYAWQAYNAAVTDCVSGAHGQLHQFANISYTEAPQSKYFFSGCGFPGPTRIVYDLMGKGDWNFYLDTTNGGNYIRQVRLGATPGFDGPFSNKAFGKLNFDSDALLLHPVGKIVSVNTAKSKLEVLHLPKDAVADADAPLAQVRSGPGTRPGLVSGPLHASMSAQGAILVLENVNNRVQAFDIGGNPIPHFGHGAYYFPLKDVPDGGAYLDISVEYAGYIFVLSYAASGTSYQYRLDIYTPEGVWLSRTTGINADKMAVSYWRDVFTLNYEPLRLPNGTLPARTEPSVSQWIPSTPGADTIIACA